MKAKTGTAADFGIKKCVLVIMLIVCMISVLTVAGCGEDKQQKTQEDFLKDVRRMSLLINPDYPGPEDSGIYTRDVVTEEIVFLPGYYELYCHAYTLFCGSGECMEYASAEEVRGLFFEFDSEVYERFRTIRNWYLLLNGRWYMDFYNDATAVARDLYNEKYGEDIMPGNWTAWSLEERIELENFIRENPDFMPVEEYEKELRYLGILTGQPDNNQ